MPNQMIALQARNPQIADPSRQTAQFANMMNMARQQEAAQRQAQQAQQTMDLAKAKESREASAAEIDRAGKLIDLYTKRAVQTLNPQGYELLLGNMDRDAPDIAAAFRANMPPEQFDRNKLLKMVGSVSDNFRATYGPLETEVVQMADGTFAVTRTGGFDKPGVFEMEEYKLAPRGGAPSQRQMPGIIGGYGGGTFNVDGTQATPVEQGANARPTQGAPTTQRDLMEQGVDSRNIPAGNPLKPISMTGGAQPNLAGVVESMMSSGQISQSNLQLMRDAAGPDKDAQLAQILKSNNIQIVPDAQASTRNAVFRPGEDTAPQMQMVQDMGDYRATGRPARGKPPMQSPMPGSAIVPLPRVSGEAAASEGGKQGVRVRTEPIIAGNTKTAELKAQKDAAFPDAQSQFDAAYTTVKNRLADIERFKKHPAATRVIGMIDAYTPNIGRARGAQELYNAMVAGATFDALQDMRNNSPTGGALGNVSDADIRLLKQSIGALGQAQDEEDFFESLNIYESRLKQILGRLETRFKEGYGYRLGKNWTPPAAAAAPRRTLTTGGRKAGAFTITEVDE